MENAVLRSLKISLSFQYRPASLGSTVVMHGI